MKLKTGLILNRISTFILGLLCIIIGLSKNINTFISIGAGMSVATVFLFAKQWHILSDPHKITELENTYNDERIIFIARKSYSFAFWISVYAEFFSLLITLYFGREDLSILLIVVVCFQIIIYVLSSMFYSKKY